MSENATLVVVGESWNLWLVVGRGNDTVSKIVISSDTKEDVCHGGSRCAWLNPSDVGYSKKPLAEKTSGWAVVLVGLTWD
jgi:hypothetical protein